MPPSISCNSREPIEMVTSLIGNPFANFPVFTIDKPKQKVAPTRLFREDLLAYVENEIASLQKNWDGYGAHPIHPKVQKKLSDLIKSIPYPFWRSVSEDDITPNNSGTVSIEWQRAGMKIFLEIGSEYSTYFVKKSGVLIETNNNFLLDEYSTKTPFLIILNRYFLP